MAKTNPTRKQQPLDIFGDERLGAAMQAATAAREGQGTQPASRVASSSAPPPAAAPAAGRADLSPRARSPAAGEESHPAAADGHVPIKFVVPRELRAEFMAFKAELGAALGGILLDNSNIGRALLARLLGPDRARLLEAAREANGTLTRPRNDDAEAMAEFDLKLSQLF